MSFHKDHLSRNCVRTVSVRVCLIVFLTCLALGNVAANQVPTAASENSSAVIQGPAPGTRSDEGLLGLDPWTVINPAPIAVSRPGGVFLDGLFYVIGGEESGGVRTGYVQIYDPQTEAWDAVSADTMPTPGSNLCAVALDGLIYVPGGWDGTNLLDQIQIFDPATGTWTTDLDDPMPAGRYGSACAEHDGKLYVFGGWDGAIGTSSAWVYDPQATSGDRWSVLSNSAFTHVYGGAIAASNGLVFVAGFSDNFSANFDTVAAYDPVADNWVAYPGLQTPRGGAGVWTRGDRLYVGGGGWSSFLTSVESYDLTEGTTGSWEFTASLNAGRRTAASGTDPVTGELFMAAGWVGAFLNSAEATAGVAVAQLDIAPAFGSLIDLGTGGSGDQLSETITAENVGGADLELDCTISNDDGGVFTLLPSDPFSVTLEPGDDPADFSVQCTVPTLAPGVSQTYSGELSCTTNDPGFPGQNTYDLACAGEGEPAAPGLDMSPAFGSLIDFGTGGSGDELSETITAQSTGNVDVDLECSLSDNAGGVFSLLPSDPFSTSLAPGADPESFQVLCTLPDFAPGTSASYAGELTCTTNDPAFPGDNSYELICAGAGDEPRVAIPVTTLGPWSLLLMMVGMLLLAGIGLRANRVG